MIFPIPSSRTFSFSKHPHTDPAAFDPCTSKDIHNTLCQPLRYVDEGEPVVDVNGADQVAVDLRLIGNCANQIAGADARVPSCSHIETNHARFGMSAASPVSHEPCRLSAVPVT